MSHLLQGVSAYTGEDFFRSLVQQLVTVFGADAAFIGEQITTETGRVRTIAVYSDGRFQENLTYPLAGSPCAETLAQPVAVCSWDVGVQKLFPDVPLLRRMGAEGYAGACLLSAKGHPLGLMALLYRRPIPDPPMVEAVLQFFAARAGAEIERCQMEEKLRRKEVRAREEHLRLLQMLEGVSEPICLYGADYRILWSNPAHQKLFGPMLIDGCCFSGSERSDHCAECPLQSCFASGQPQETVKRVDGKTLGIKMFPLVNLAGSADAIIAFISDITEKMRKRQEVEQQARLIALGELAAGVAHEINNPNALVLLNAPLLREVWQAATPLLDQQAAAGDFSLGKLPYSRLREQVPQLFLQMEHAAERIRSIVEELKDFVSPGERVEAFADLGLVLRLAVEQVQPLLKGTTVTIEEMENMPPVRGSAQRLEQVFVNLLTNALQALDRPEQQIRVNLKHSSMEGSNVVEVIDEGVGMVATVLQRITDPFFTTRRHVGGLGLGLSVSARIVRDHGGHLHFSSNPGQGTTVQVVLPARTGE
jgi:signal transduction histidine kinase